MKYVICLFVFITGVLSVFNAEINNTPIIGVLAQTLSTPLPLGSSYIAASYVKYLESAGARVVPVKVNQSHDEYKRLFNSINGVLFPGGGVSLISSGYAKAAKTFYKLAIEANNEGDYFPIWGTCLGFEELTYLTSGKLLLTATNTSAVALPLIFTNDSVKSQMFKDFPADVLRALASEPITENSHRWSLSIESYNKSKELRNFYSILTTNTDGKVDFVSTMEAYDFPFYGTQWHPEKNAFEWTRPVIPHSRSAVRATFYMADFFVNEDTQAAARISACMSDISAWMTLNHLKLNPDKTEILHLPATASPMIDLSITVENIVTPSPSAKSLGVVLDERLDFTAHKPPITNVNNEEDTCQPVHLSRNTQKMQYQ